MLILFDQGTPVGIRILSRAMSSRRHVNKDGATLLNRELLRRAEEAGFLNLHTAAPVGASLSTFVGRFILQANAKRTQVVQWYSQVDGRLERRTA
jgi:hypothetical protein